jgi:hypothetical protein
MKKKKKEMSLYFVAGKILHVKSEKALFLLSEKRNRAGATMFESGLSAQGVRC